MDKEAVVRLIEAYKAKEVLWNPSHPNYYNRVQKKDAWDEISHEIHRPVEEVKKKVEYLLSALRREKVKMAKSKTTGQGANAIYKSTWFAYEHLTFLLDKNKPRERLNTEDSSINEILVADTESDEGELTQSLAEASHRSSNRVRENVITSPMIETEPFTAPPISNKRAKKKATEKDPILTEALQLIKSSAQATASAVTPIAPDSFQIYANYLASKFRTYSRKTFISVEHKINNILHSADNGQYEWERGLRTSTPTEIVTVDCEGPDSVGIQSHQSSHPENSLSPNQCVSYPVTFVSTEMYEANSVNDDTVDFTDLVKFNARR